MLGTLPPLSYLPQVSGKMSVSGECYNTNLFLQVIFASLEFLFSDRNKNTSGEYDCTKFTFSHSLTNPKHDKNSN